MRIPIKAKIRRGDDKIVTEEALLWVGEIPLEYQRGRNRKMKRRRYKQQKNQEERLGALL